MILALREVMLPDGCYKEGAATRMVILRCLMVCWAVTGAAIRALQSRRFARFCSDGGWCRVPAERCCTAWNFRPASG